MTTKRESGVPTSRRTIPRLFCALLTAAALATTLAAQGAWSPHFDMPGFGIGGRVFGLGTWHNELIACTYRTPWRDGNRLNHVARFDGVRWHPIGSGVNDAVRCAIEFQGDLYIGGRFTYAGLVPAAAVARWNGSQWQPLGGGFWIAQGVVGEVWSLCEYQGALYAAGEFNETGGMPVSGIAKWNGSQWLPVAGGLQWVLGGQPRARTLATDGAFLYVGGEFDRAGSVPASHVARWNGSTWSPLGGGIANFGWGIVDTLWPHQGRLYCGGAFGQAGSVQCENIAAWDGAQWHAVGAGVQGSTYGAMVNSLCTWNGELYVGGSFVYSGATELWRIARFDGTALQPIGGVAQAEVNPPAVFAMTAWNNRLYCGGEFQVAGEPDVPELTRGVYHIAAWDGASWSAVGDGLGLNNEVYVLGTYQGQTIVGGRFTIAGGNRAIALARFDGDDWRYLATFDGVIRGMVVHNGDLWLAGEFYTVNGIVADGVARFDGSTWSAVGGGPGPHRASCIAVYQGMIHIGSIGTPQRWTGATWQTFTPGITGAISVLHEHQGVLYLGGSTPFHPGAPNLFVWDGTTMSVAGGGTNGAVRALLTVGNDLIVGGTFTTAGGVPARSIASWNGSSWSAFGGGLPGGVAALTTFGGSLIAGGGFNAPQGAPADYIARWTGTGWAPLAGAQPNGAIFALLADDPRGELLAGGWYGQVGSGDAGYLCAFESVPFWTDVGQAVGNARRTPRLGGDGRLLAGSRTRWRLSSAAESSLAVLAMGTSRIDAPLFGGVLVPSPDALNLLITDGAGTAEFSLAWPGPLPGFQAWAQAWVLDPSGPQGFTTSNGTWLRAP
ncbi:MAG TPA: hypothetical protein VF384_06650 [Planctomycetota bacterium]